MKTSHPQATSQPIYQFSPSEVCWKFYQQDISPNIQVSDDKSYFLNRFCRVE